MSSITHRPALSFEVAPQRESHPNRTDIACFVGVMARRREAAPRRVMPEVLARWIERQPEFRIRLKRDAARMRRAVVELEDVDAFKASLQATLGTDAWPTILDTSALLRLLHACRDLTPIPAAVVDALHEAGFTPGSLLGRASSATPLAISGAQLDGFTRIQQLMNLPFRCEGFELIDNLFAWESRGIDPNDTAIDAPCVTTPLGAALRAYFATGGRTCHVVVTGEPVALFATIAQRYAALAGEPIAPASFDLSARVPILPGIRTDFPAAAMTPAPVSTDPTRWRGIEHVFGLEDASFVVLPDLVDAIAQEIPQILKAEETLVVREVFQECADRPAPARLPIGRRLPAPRLGLAELDAWRHLLSFARALLDNPVSMSRRDVELLASLPLPADETALPKQGDWAQWLAEYPGLHSDRIQLVWPWLRTRESADCQGGFEAPEGSFAGVLSASALQSGSYRSATRFPVDRLIDIEPRLNLGQATADAVVTDIGDFTLADRVCLIAPSPRGPELVSDVTLAADPLFRAGAVRRLINVVIQQARAIGHDLVFDPNGEALWEEITDRLNDLGRLLISVGAVSSDAGRNAFVVRCGRSTMTQADIDAGRAIVEIEVVPAQPIVRIVVVLDMRDGASAA